MKIKVYLQEKFKDIKNFWEDKIYYPIRNRFFCKYWLVDTKLNKWRYHDLVVIIPEAIFNCLVSYVEEEQCFETISYEYKKEEEKIIKEAYFFIKVRRPKLEKLKDKLLDTLFGENGLCNVEFDELEITFNYKDEDKYNKRKKLHDKIEMIISEETRKHLMNIVSIYDSLWT